MPPASTTTSPPSAGPKKRPYWKRASISRCQRVALGFAGRAHGGGRRRRDGDGAERSLAGDAGVTGDAGNAQQLAELARGVHLAHDVAAADEAPVDVELGDRRPLAVLLDPVADLGAAEHVDRLVRGEELVEDAHHLGGEPARGGPAVALHEEDDGVRLHKIVQPAAEGGVEAHEGGN